ncbi:hypothetical protein AVEN_194733-1 [Araneus ventricosus]|uniref:Uncharacterized protein n=1 Tax=Araneus ventricosus TaxID=182803 RepID=A0A4Y2UJX7_ARAVE|nr:hypothetical protein AVEN_194733-1 [Araneus ventricosus]
MLRPQTEASSSPSRTTHLTWNPQKAKPPNSRPNDCRFLSNYCMHDFRTACLFKQGDWRNAEITLHLFILRCFGLSTFIFATGGMTQCVQVNISLS